MNIGSFHYPLIILKCSILTSKITNHNQWKYKNESISGDSELRIDMNATTLDARSSSRAQAWAYNEVKNRLWLETDKQTDTDFGNIIYETGLEVTYARAIRVAQLDIEIYDWKTGTDFSSLLKWLRVWKLNDVDEFDFD